MSDYSRVLGDVVKVAREQAGFTQAELAATIGRDTRTVLNIENYKGNPKLEVLFPLVRALKIDSKEIFYPEMRSDTSALRQLRLLVADCSEEEATAIIPVLQAAIQMARDCNTTAIK